MSAAPTITSTGKIVAPRSIEISRSEALQTGVNLDEIIPTTVLSRNAGNKYTLALKNLQITATSDIPLKVGDKLLLKVSSLQPQIVLNPVENKNQSSSLVINESLRQWRTNPQSLLQVIDKLAGFIKLVQAGDLPPGISSSDAEKLIKLFENIIFSSRTKGNSLFLKDFIAKTGLRLENSLSQLVAESARGKLEKPPEDNLKTLLLKISAAVRSIVGENPDLDAETMARLTKISAFADEAIKTIEIKQVLNSVFQDSDNGLALQVPLAMADGYRLANIFITPEGKDDDGKSGKFSSCSVAVFLDLDILGQINVNAGISAGGFNCVIKCARDEARNLISSNLDELKKSLAMLGYRIGYVDCIQEDDLSGEWEDFLSRQSFSTVELVNYFA